MNTFEVSTQVLRNIPHLTFPELKKLQELTSDILADDEFAQCAHCDAVFSWNDVVDAKDEKIPPHSYHLSGISCPTCKTYKLKKMYGNQYIDVLKRRFSKAVYTSLSVSEISGNWVGYTHAYLGSLHEIYNDPLYPHFGNIPIEGIRGKIEQTLGREFPLSESLYYISFIGLLKKYSNGQNIFQQLQSLEVPNTKIVGLSEDNKKTGIYKTLVSIGAKEVLIDKSLQKNTHPESDWSILLFPDARAIYDTFLKNGLMGYRQAMRQKRRQFSQP